MIIYHIKNTINTKSYIGQTKYSIEKRWKQHISSSKKRNSHFSRAIQKYGTECWTFEILEEIDEINLLNEREVFWIAHFDSFNPEKGYNSTTGGKQFTICSEETRKKKSINSSGKNNPMYGKKFTDEHKNKISLSNKNKKRPNKFYMTNGIINRIVSFPYQLEQNMKDGFWKGRIVIRKISEETRNKIRQSNLGKICSEESKLKQSLKRKGKDNPAYGRIYCWINNGIKNKKLFEGQIMPENFQLGFYFHKK